MRNAPILIAVLTMFVLYQYRPSSLRTVRDIKPTKRAVNVPTGRETELVMQVDSSRCMEPQRMGNSGDGGWWICQMWSPITCIVYSYGIRDDFSFDKSLAAKGCQVHGFDPSDAGLASRDAYTLVPATYHSFGLGGEDMTWPPGKVPFEWPGINYLAGANSNSWELSRLSSTMHRLKHTHLMFLKVDVEGSEWAALPDILTTSWSQLMMEVHFPPNWYQLERLEKGGVRLRYLGGATICESHGQPCVKRLWLLEQLGQIATLWRLKTNGKHCLELSYIRHEQPVLSITQQIMAMARSVAMMLHEPLKKLLSIP
jgi:hypothetical protein|eukprot:COSAG01_NODE_1165_length_11446_cov_16.276196_2_plen_313_part_00